MTRLLLMIPADLMALTLLGAIISSRRGSLAIPDRRYLEAGKDFDALSPEQQAEFPRPLLRRYGIDRKE